MEFKYYLWLFTILLFLASCSHHNTTERSFTSYRSDSISFDADIRLVSDLQHASSAKYFYDSATNIPYIVVADLNKRILYHYSLNGKLVKTTIHQGLPNAGIWDVCILSDSLYYYSHDDGTISICNAERLLRSFKILQDLDDAYYCYSLAPNTDLKTDPDTSFYLMMIDRTSDPNIPGWLEHRFSPPCIGRFKVRGDSIVCIDSAGYFPGDYKTQYHHEIYPMYTENKSVLAYTFSDADSIFIQRKDRALPREAIAISTFKKDLKPLPFNRDSLGNILYTERYYVESPNISLFRYDPYHEVYYLGIQEGIEFDDGGMVHDVNDAPSELIILDAQLKKIKSIHFPGGRFRRLSKTVITPDGIYIQLANKRNLVYEKYNFL